MNGFIIIKRELLQNEWYQSENTIRLYIHLLIKANFKDKKWQGKLIKRGQLITSTSHLSIELKQSVQKIKTALHNLESTGYIIKQSTNRYTLITLINYDESQDSDYESNQQVIQLTTNKELTNNKPITTTEQDNKENKVIQLNKEERRELFKSKVFTHKEYSRHILNEFLEYWTESSELDQKMKFEYQKTFNIETRLKKWKSLEQNFNKKASNSKHFHINR